MESALWSAQTFVAGEAALLIDSIFPVNTSAWLGEDLLHKLEVTRTIFSEQFSFFCGKMLLSVFSSSRFAIIKCFWV